MKTVNYIFLSKNYRNFPIKIKMCYYFVYSKIYFGKQLSQVFCTTLSHYSFYFSIILMVHRCGASIMYSNQTLSNIHIHIKPKKLNLHGFNIDIRFSILNYCYIIILMSSSGQLAVVSKQ